MPKLLSPYCLLALLASGLQSCSRGSTCSGDTSGAGTYTASVEKRPKSPGELRAELLVLGQEATWM